MRRDKSKKDGTYSTPHSAKKINRTFSTKIHLIRAKKLKKNKIINQEKLRPLWWIGIRTIIRTDKKQKDGMYLTLHSSPQKSLKC